VEGKAPDYPAAAAATPKSSCKIEEKLTASRPRYGRLMTLSGFAEKTRNLLADFRQLFGKFSSTPTPSGS
jgi:hypothetical protein